MLLDWRKVAAATYIAVCSSAQVQAQDMGMASPDVAGQIFLTPDAAQSFLTPDAAQSATGMWAIVPNASFLDSNIQDGDRPGNWAAVDWQQMQQSDLDDREAVVVPVNPEERSELEDLLTREGNLAPSDRVRLEEFMERGVVIPLIDPPIEVPEPIRPTAVNTKPAPAPAPKKCDDGTVLPVYCRYLAGRECICP